ncbi:MAG: imidazoleglycerol-phosphate dehydratase HisB [Betaproteobacteria bacterium AqS2]|uniref:Imidazoleglycerol-phosphate dehydratase n=1 Tax=Candidatus Amphirhobacter heronislandensis TaxID=1732024 RepID=A0A930UD83_9GAMM|nr:imidazoleglycerol-phosphate dehydratase HisB [Betaproteobacteria bacterium AqS2]
MAEARRATIERATGETAIKVALRLAPAKAEIATGIAFFDHMLAQIAQHGQLGLAVKAKGDLDVDFHHTVEDVGIALGMALEKALGDKKGIARFADACAPLDEALARVVLDLSGRPGLYYRATFSRPAVGDFDVQLVREFFQGFANAAKATLHVDLLAGANAHHQAEAIFKAFALALRQAVAPVGAAGAIPSTKGRL